VRERWLSFQLKLQSSTIRIRETEEGLGCAAIPEPGFASRQNPPRIPTARYTAQCPIEPGLQRRSPKNGNILKNGQRLSRVWRPDRGESAPRRPDANPASPCSGVSRRTLRNYLILQGLLAGAGGFEPPHGGIKIHCLTTWRRPTGPEAVPLLPRGILRPRRCIAADGRFQAWRPGFAAPGVASPVATLIYRYTGCRYRGSRPRGARPDWGEAPIPCPGRPSGI
jgi:hypothetical protein